MLSWLLVGFAQASEARIEFRVVDQDEMGVPLARIRVVCGGVPLVDHRLSVDGDPWVSNLGFTDESCAIEVDHPALPSTWVVAADGIHHSPVTVSLDVCLMTHEPMPVRKCRRERRRYQRFLRDLDALLGR